MRSVYRIGQRFGRLVVKAQLGQYSSCVCDCGKNTGVRTDKLIAGRTKSCGCLGAEMRAKTSEEAKKTRDARDAASVIVKAAKVKERRKIVEAKYEEKIASAPYKLKNIWTAMMQRCYNPGDKSYPRYGGRVITVCERWKDADNFLADMLPLYKPNRWLERRNNDEGYTPDNCEFATAKKQGQNRRNTLYLDNWGFRVSLSNKCRRHGVNYNAAYRWFKEIDRTDEVPSFDEFKKRFGVA